MPSVATSPTELLAAIAGSAHLDGELLVIDDEGAFRDTGIRELAWTAAFSTDDDTTAAAQWLVWEASQALGARSASIQALYEARARGELSGFTVPALNLRTQTFDMARTVYEAAEAADVAALIVELARSEQTYSFQRPIDYATSVLAGAIAAGWQGPVFIQGDHYQFNAKKYATDPEVMTEEIRRACRLAVDAGYRNIDIDSSTLVDLSKPTVDEEQRQNYVRAAELTALIRTLESDGVTISVGGEIGEVGTQNSTVEELRAYLDGYRRELEARAPGAKGISKVSVQTGTSHGGVPLPDGGVAEVKLDFEVLRELGVVAREYGLAGAVQHGASTLPDELFHRFPAVETAEIHLATGFQNTVYEHPAFPESLHREIEAWVVANCADERKPGQTDQQFVYSSRKKALGPFKRQLWELELKDEILAAQRRKISYLFTELRVNDSRPMVEKYIQPVELHRPIPDALRGAVAAR
jgi:fructose/tagatose bisphosphate aldolase